MFSRDDTSDALFLRTDSVSHSLSTSLPAPGSTIAGHQLIRLVGAGGMGQVWEVRHPRLRSRLALKLLADARLKRMGWRQRRTAVHRFVLEARVMARLRSPHAIRVFDLSATEEDGFFYTMELLLGSNMRDLVEETGCVEPAHAATLLAQVCVGLAEAHAIGLVHRDLKPSNVFVETRPVDPGHVRLLDYGLAAPADAPRILSGGLAVGTPAFVAPEVALALPEIGPRADIYLVGCLAWWLLAGTPVFDGRTAPELLVAHIHKRPGDIRARTQAPIPESMAEVIMSCLEKDPANRPTDARELNRVFTSLGAPGSAPPCPTPLEPRESPPSCSDRPAEGGR